MNIFSKKKTAVSSSVNTSTSVKNSITQTILFLFTGFLLSQFFLLNILYTQHPQGGWVTPFGSVTTVSLLAVSLLAIFVCLISLWRSASQKLEASSDYSIPTIFTKVSPE
jgi:mannose/fructose/N-acetylgalactosamine-specific phosphotransferase system component IIC